MEMMTVIVLRCVERLASILICGLFAWLGYKLFLDVPTKPDSSGKFTLPGGTAIHLMRVGPGIFFALFGVGIVLASFLNPVSFEQPDKTGKAVTGQQVAGMAGTPAGDHSKYVGAGEKAAASLATRDMDRAHCVNAIAALNNIEANLKPDLDGSLRSDIEIAIPQVKLAAMKALWAEDWGDYASFKEWVQSGKTNEPPDLKTAADYFNKR